MTHKNRIGNLFSLTSFGESHGPAIGGVIDGVPAGVTIDMEQLLDLCDALNHNFLDDIQLCKGMKSNLCPRELHIDLNLDDLSDEKVVRVGRFLEELKDEKCLKL